jgi:hypothetical protein
MLGGNYSTSVGQERLRNNNGVIVDNSIVIDHVHVVHVSVIFLVAC